jgi:hypothetical protein
MAAMVAIFGVCLLLNLPVWAPIPGLLALWGVLMYAYRGRR